MPTYQVQGPFVVPTYNGKAAKIIDSEKLDDFWKRCGDVARRRGCYIFAIRAGKGITPIYVGKTARSFLREAFAVHKLEKYQRCLADYRKGTPLLFFLAAPSAKGATNQKVIGELEDFLIQTAISRNPRLLNVKGTKREEWSIAGVVRSGVGKPSQAAKALKRTLGL